MLSPSPSQYLASEKSAWTSPRSATASSRRVIRTPDAQTTGPGRGSSQSVGTPQQVLLGRALWHPRRVRGQVQQYAKYLVSSTVSNPQ
jgi:hypothetical protein